MNRWLRFVLAMSLMAGLWLGSAAPTAADASVHVVQPGDTLADIAHRYGVTISALMQANGLNNPNLIWPGQRLAIPGASTPSAPAQGQVHTVRAGETLNSIARLYGVSLASLVQANGISNVNYIYVGQRLAIPSGGGSSTPPPRSGSTHTVQYGDTMAKIAVRYGTTISAIAAANGISNPALIYVGQVLTIPAGGSSSPQTPSGGGLRFYVSISQQRCYLYRDGALLYNWACSTGRAGAATITGDFKVQSKIRSAFGSRFNAWMPYWLGIYWAGTSENGIHALPIDAYSGVTWWADKVGTPITFGCIMLDNQAAITLWNLAYIGMPVIIRY